MIGVAFALIVMGVIVLFIVPWVGIVVGIAGLILLVVHLFGLRKRPAESP
jgi:hypothetical protein